MWYLVFRAQFEEGAWSLDMWSYYKILSWPKNQYWDEQSNFKLFLMIAQFSQVLDVVISVAGVTKNNAWTVLKQISSRFWTMIMVFPFVEQNNYSIFMVVFFWCLAEMARFSH
jgi:hypothetical protein